MIVHLEENSVQIHVQESFSNRPTVPKDPLKTIFPCSVVMLP